jgi:hypothetical protein
MGGLSRSQGRAACGTMYKLFAPGEMSGRTIRFVTARQAAVNVASGKWREVVYEDDLGFAGYQPREAPEPQPISKAKTGRDSVIDMSKAATITLAEVRMNAGEMGRSRTAGMAEWKRERRVRRAQEFRRIVALEDAIERAQEKVKQWPYPANLLGTDDKGAPVYGDRAIRVYPKAPQRRGPVAGDPAAPQPTKPGRRKA